MTYVRRASSITLSLIVAILFGAVALARAQVQVEATRPATPTPESATKPTTAPATAPSSVARGAPAAVVVLDGDINDYTRQIVARRFALAREAGARVVILEIDTYGGYVDAGQAIARFLKRQDDLHVIAYIPVKAISAGAMIAVAADEIVMEPESQIGNSGVITGSGQELSGTNRAKAESMVIEEFHDSARQNGYDPLLLEAMVVVERSVHYIEHVETGQRRFVNPEDYTKLTADGTWRPVPGVRNPLDASDTLLTMGSDLAKTVGLASEIATDRATFAASRGYTIVGEFVPVFGDRVVAFFNSFAVRGILTTVLLFSLYMSFSSPGQGMPEVVALVALGGLFGVPMLTGYATWIELVAVLLGLLLIAVELFVLPGFGLPGITGIILVLGGLVMTFAPPVTIPDATFGFAIPWGSVAQGLFVVTGGLVCSLLLWFWLNRYLPRLPYFNRLVLTTVAGGSAAGAATANGGTRGSGPAVGDAGEALSDLRPGGSARLQPGGQVLPVVSDSGFVKAGERVIVREVSGNRIVVRAVVR